MKGLLGGSLEMSRLAQTFQSRRAILTFSIFGPFLVLLFLDVFVSLVFVSLGISLIFWGVFRLFSKVSRGSQGEENPWCF